MTFRHQNIKNITKKFDWWPLTVEFEKNRQQKYSTIQLDGRIHTEANMI